MNSPEREGAATPREALVVGQEAIRRQREREALDWNCPYCCATPGQPCVNQASIEKGLKRPHPERIRQVPHV